MKASATKMQERYFTVLLKGLPGKVHKNDIAALVQQPDDLFQPLQRFKAVGADKIMRLESFADSSIQNALDIVDEDVIALSEFAGHEKFSPTRFAAANSVCFRSPFGIPKNSCFSKISLTLRKAYDFKLLTSCSETPSCCAISLIFRS
jgi:hypothetical protein